MEVGAVKQAFNNEVILLKKKLNQAKIQIIHKLTRKAKTLAEKKGPENIQQKFKRKAESAVNEVLIMKKIKAKDLAKFIVTHKGQLNEYLNKPNVDQDKACAHLLLHKSLQDKYTLIRRRFSNIPIEDLFMSRLDRRKIKKEAHEQRKNKKKGKNPEVVNAEGDWKVEDVEVGDTVNNDEDGSTADESGNDSVNSDDENQNSDDGSGDDGDNLSDNEQNSEQESALGRVKISKATSESDSDNANLKDTPKKSIQLINMADKAKKSNLIKGPEDHLDSDADSVVIPKEHTDKEDMAIRDSDLPRQIKKKSKDPNKNKKLNEKIQQKKFKKVAEVPVIENKIVDSFFITSTGENYLTVVEPRAPDEVKEEHKQGNRKLRRAVMFGLAPKIKHRKTYSNDNSYNDRNGFERGNNLRNNNDNKFGYNNNRQSFNDRPYFNDKNARNVEEKVVKLHPSWEAKKKQSGILPFEGKKIVFDES